VRPFHGPDWPAWTAWAALVSGFLLAGIGALVLQSTAVAFGAPVGDPPAGVSLLSTLTQDGVLVLVAWLFARRSDATSWHDFGIVGTGALRGAGAGLLVWASFAGFTALWLAITGRPPETSELPGILGAEDGTGALIATAVLVCVVAPICEEVFFRGYFFGSLSTWRGVWPAALLTGVVFGAIHAGATQPQYLVPLAYFGFALCALRVITGSLVPSIGVHALNNGIALGAALGWSWEVTATVTGAAVTTVLTVVLLFAAPVPGPRLLASAAQHPAESSASRGSGGTT
jgi:membrane protease YdiL (CAAX protease family)